MKSGFPSIRIRTITLLLGWFVAAAVSADFKRDYGAGVRDFNSGDYADAIDSLQKAIDEESTAQEKVRIYGMRYEPYIPYFFLGQAKFKNGDCKGALAAWNLSLAQGVIKQQEQFAEMQANMATCDSMKVDVTRIAREAEDAIGVLERNIALFAQLKKEQLLSSEWASRWEPELKKAETTVKSLQQQLGSAVTNTDESAIKAILSEAQKAADVIGGAQGMAVARIDSIKQDQAQNVAKQREDARRSLSQAISSGNSIEMTQGSEQMATLKQQLDTLLAQGNNAVNNSATKIKEYQELAQSITNVSRRYAAAEQDWQTQQRLAQAAEKDAAAAREAAQRRIPPPALKKIAEAYFAGNYQSAVQLSNPDSLKENREKIQALLFRAAANHKLFILSGEKNTQARQRSEDDIKAIKRLNKNFTPYIAAFSPRFLELFRQSG